jgi:signal transduction histidine kinase
MPISQPPTVSIAAAVVLASVPSSAVAADGVPGLYFGAAAILGVLLVGLILFAVRRSRRERQTEMIRLNSDKAALQRQLDQAEARHLELDAALEQTNDSLRRAQRQQDDYRALLDAAPFAVWERKTDLSLAWINRTYGHMIGEEHATAQSPGVVEIASAIDPEQPRRLARQALQSGEPQRETRHFVIGGDRRALDIWETPLAPGGNLAGFAVDATELEESQTELARHIEAHGEVLENMATAIAIYGPDKRLMFYNRAYSKLWRLEEEFLNHAPHISEVLTAQRENRRLPEQADFVAYKESRVALFTNVIDPQEDLVQLPDETMLRTVTTAHPFGGLLFMFEDVTDQLVLERSRNTLIAVQRATLNNLYEGVAVFGSDGRIKLFNSEYARIWGLNEDFLLSEPHIGEILDRAEEPLLRSPERREDIVAETTSRADAGGRMEQPDGRVVDYAVVRLPDGQSLFTYLDVTDSLRVERALRELNDALLAADRLKSEFIANVSYELRTPLNSIIGFTEILKNQYFGELNERQSEYIDDVLVSSEQLLTLINAILDLASVEAGHLELNLAPVDLREAMQGVVNLSLVPARKQELALELDCPADIGIIEADDRRVKQIMYNLLSNAIKFTPEGGVVTLGAARRDDGISIWVADTGVGIARSDQSEVFESFRKGSQQTASRGAGIGLSLVRRFVELHGGRVDLASRPGQGTTVTCLFPISPNQTAAASEQIAAKVAPAGGQ